MLEREFKVSEKWLIAIFVMGLMVMLLSLGSVVVNWKAYQSRAELQQRVIVLEESQQKRQPAQQLEVPPPVQLRRGPESYGK